METHELRLMSLGDEIALENEDPIIFPPLLHAVRNAEIQCQRASILCQCAAKNDSLLDEDKAEVLNSLQNAKCALGTAKRDLSQFLAKIGSRKAKTYLSLSQKLQVSRKRSMALRRWMNKGILLPTDACYQALADKSAEFVSKSRQAASLLALMEEDAKTPIAPKEDLATVQEDV